MNRQNTLVVMPTGAGKSLCYQLLVSLLQGTTLVVSTLIALMKDQMQIMQKSASRASHPTELFLEFEPPLLYIY